MPCKRMPRIIMSLARQNDIMVKTSEITVPMEPELEQAIEDQLGYGDSKAEYIREAVRQRLDGGDAETDGGEAQLAD